jgi:hypothetical protein
MNREEIIRMAKESDATISLFNGRFTMYIDELERFAALVAEHLRYDGIHSCHLECQRPACVAMREAVQAERKAAWEAVNALIVPGDIGGNGTDPTAQRNGIVLAANVLMSRIGGRND